MFYDESGRCFTVIVVAALIYLIKRYDKMSGQKLTWKILGQYLGICLKGPNKNRTSDANTKNGIQYFVDVNFLWVTPFVYIHIYRMFNLKVGHILI
jgi:hypothetical protein